LRQRSLPPKIRELRAIRSRKNFTTDYKGKKLRWLSVFRVLHGLLSLLVSRCNWSELSGFVLNTKSSHPMAAPEKEKARDGC